MDLLRNFITNMCITGHHFIVFLLDVWDNFIFRNLVISSLDFEKYKNKEALENKQTLTNFKHKFNFPFDFKKFDLKN